MAAKAILFLAMLAALAGCHSQRSSLAHSRQLQDTLDHQQSWQKTFQLCQQQDQNWRQGKTMAASSYYCQQILAQPESARWYFLYGRLLGLQRQTAASDYFLRLALAKDPDYVWANHGLGVLALKKQDYFQARLYFSKCLLNVPDFVPALVGMARVATATLPPQAISYLERALQVMPQSASLHHHIARVLIQNKRLDQAQRHLTTAARLAPEDKTLLKELALLYFRQGDKRATATALRKLASLTIPDHQRQKILRLVERLERESDAHSNTNFRH